MRTIIGVVVIILGFLVWDIMTSPSPTAPPQAVQNDDGSTPPDQAQVRFMNPDLARELLSVEAGELVNLKKTALKSLKAMDHGKEVSPETRQRRATYIEIVTKTEEELRAMRAEAANMK